jgi:hypothetical protein
MSLVNADKFPLFRKYEHGSTYFKIISADSFEELKIMGNNYSLKHYKATILPDRNYISDLIKNEGNHWKIIEEYEFNEALKNCEQNKQKVDWL